MRQGVSNLAAPAGRDRVSGLRPIYQSSPWQAQRQRNLRRCLFIIRYLRPHRSANRKTPHGTEENTQTVGEGTWVKHQNVMGLGKESASAERTISDTNCRVSGYQPQNC